MSDLTPSIQVLVVEPNQALTTPYQFFPKEYKLDRAKTIKQATDLLANNTYQLFSISSSFSAENQLILLNSFKHQFKKQVIPLLVVINLSQPISSVVGTNWSNKIAFLANNASSKLTLSTLELLLSA